MNVINLRHYSWLFEHRVFLYLCFISLFIWILLLIQDLALIQLIGLTHFEHHGNFEKNHGFMLAPLNQILSLHWISMLLVMMLPLLFLSIDQVIQKNFKRKRIWGILLFFGGYIVLWSSAGMILSIMTLVLSRLLDSSFLLSLFILIAMILWQVTPYKQMSLNRCHFDAPINPFGIRAGIDCFLYGLKKAGYCITGCWPFMWLCIAWMQPTMYIMPVFTMFLLYESLRPKRAEVWGLKIINI